MKPLNPPITDWQGRRVWVIGASSGIGAALTGQLREAGAHLALSARSEGGLQAIAHQQDLLLSLTVTDAEAVARACDELIETWGAIDMVIYCAGVYSPMRAWEIDLECVDDTLMTNLQGVYHLLATIVPHYLRTGSGGLCLLASVAGFSGLPKALAYGPTKAAIINLAQILYSDLSSRGVGVYLVNPGFVETRLTQQNDFSMPALISPDQAAQSIITGMSKGRFEIHFPKRFTLPMRWLARLPDRLRFYLVNKAVSS
ncbi:SDR family NAD(P)-dependent oxidoreductase [Sedimenticola selenatireducens]|uniref:SDR family NAD(P)-dependent oxidoreductase n=1 Tax=Sedimenticola selenatireducens TaxID=191960 RepID=A0A558DWB2_9GAMM|nr:SDR family NAD(P)-dependent oxidoreductase [Sedimenticola selenatireducens]TVO77898.1 SDR family NAD(P)-dependent oxidoreductase [Sedimenticola selenatireducens]TVT65203.1 MAG: SDR family NAD(P)-dependent oxidoreductase [Sedimenticola selenatireducens]